MHFQQTEWSCGPASVQNALEVLHRRVSQASLYEVCGTTEGDGTDEDGIKRALLANRCTVDEWRSSCWRDSERWLRLSLRAGRPAILCTDRWSHWVCAIGMVGADVLVFDPARESLNLARAGLTACRPKILQRRWGTAKRVRERDPRYYGIAAGYGALQSPCQPPSR